MVTAELYAELMVHRPLLPRREFSAEGPQLCTMTTKQASDLLGFVKPDIIKRLLVKEELSFASERERYGVAGGYVSWWEIIRLGAYQYLRHSPGTREPPLRAGLTILEFDLSPFVVARHKGRRPVVLDAIQAGSFADSAWDRVYDPTDLMASMGLAWRRSGRPTAEPMSADKPIQEVLDPSFREPTLFDS